MIKKFNLSFSYCLNFSAIKPVLEGHLPQYRLAGDSGYPMSRLMVTPYRTNEAMGKLDLEEKDRIKDLQILGRTIKMTDSSKRKMNYKDALDQKIYF